jgi:hypothetical protein
MGPGEVRRTERWLATARVLLAVSALVAIWMDPAEVRYSLWAYGLLAFYIAQGVIIIIFLRRRQESTPSFRLLVHSADVIWPALLRFRSRGCRLSLGIVGDSWNCSGGRVVTLDRKFLPDSS